MIEPKDYKDDEPEISYGAFGCIILAMFWMLVAGFAYWWFFVWEQ